MKIPGILAALACAILLAGCAQMQPKPPPHLRFLEYVKERYGVSFPVPDGYQVVRATPTGVQDDYSCIFEDPETGTRLVVLIRPGCCGVSESDESMQAWRKIEQCVAAEMRDLVRSSEGVVSSDYYVYSRQAVYFRKGSFVTQMMVYDRKLTFMKQGKEYRTKSLADAYRFQGRYIILEAGYTARADHRREAAQVLSDFLDAVVYPDKTAP